MLTHRLAEHLRRFGLRRAYRCRELLSRLRLQRRDLGHMRGVRIPALCLDLYEVLAELLPSCLSVVELRSPRRERSVVLLRRFSRRACRRRDLGSRVRLQLGRLCCERGFRVVPGCLKPIGRQRLHRRDLGHMRGVRVAALCLDSREGLFELLASCFGVVELRAHRRRDLRVLLRRFSRFRLQLGHLCCQRGVRVAPGCLEPVGRQRLHRRDLGHMRGVRVAALCLDLHEGLFELQQPRFGFVELRSPRRERGVVLLRRFGRQAHRRLDLGSRFRLQLGRE